MSKFLRKLAKKELLVPHIDSYLNKGVFPETFYFHIQPNKEKDNFFHPSGDCTPCERELFAKFSGELPRKGINASSQKNFLVGHFWHIALQTILSQELGFTTEDHIERKLTWKSPEGWTVTGSADISYLWVPGYEKPYLIDFKTMNARMFAADPIDEYMVNKWRHQVNIYMDLLRKLDDDMDHPDQCIMVVIEKDTPHKFKEVLIDYDPQLCECVYDKWTTVYEALKADIPPRCEHPFGECPVEHLYVRP